MHQTKTFITYSAAECYHDRFAN